MLSISRFSTPSVSVGTVLLLIALISTATAQDQAELTSAAGSDSSAENTQSAAPDEVSTAMSAQAQPQVPQRPIEQITIRAEQTVMALRYQLRRAEDAMYASFNELNNDDDFDITCRSVKRAGTHIAQRECEPRFFTRERQSNAMQVISQMRDGGGPTGGGLGGAAVAGAGGAGVATNLNFDAIEDYQQLDGELKSLLGKKYEAMNEEMFRIASENPDFLNALLRVEAYRQALADARDEKYQR